GPKGAAHKWFLTPLARRAAMECRKCQGLMVEEWCADDLDDAFIWKCVNCGAMVDPIILRNRGGPFSPLCLALEHPER
ncbi:MAG: hypothetical protein ACREI3_04730, partial [Nitrospirales bacterium]